MEEDLLYDTIEEARHALKLEYPSNAILKTYTLEAIEEAKNFTHREDITDLRSAILHMVCYKYEVRGSEGLTAEGFDGVSLSYNTDYPETILRELKAKRKAIFI